MQYAYELLCRLSELESIKYREVLITGLLHLEEILIGIEATI